MSRAATLRPSDPGSRRLAGAASLLTRVERGGPNAAILLVHLVAFAAYLGAGFAQLQMLKLPARDGTPAAVRDSYERLAATIITTIEVPAIFASIASGTVFIAQKVVLLVLVTFVRLG